MKYALRPFLGYRLYGPRFHKGEGRNMVVLFKSNKDRTTMSYARYLMSTLLGRKLHRTEDVDHIDNDKTNDDIHNLQVLPHGDNIRKSHVRAMRIITACGRCGRRFFVNPNRRPFIRRHRPYYCSQECISNRARPLPQWQEDRPHKASNVGSNPTGSS